MLVDWKAIWDENRVAERSLEQAQASMRQNLIVSWRYRFFFRELIPILGRDAVLKDHFLTTRRERVANFEALLNSYVDAGLLRRPADPDEFRLLVSACLLINNQWLIEAEMAFGTLDTEQIERGIALLMYMLRPYLVLNNDF